MTMTRDKPEPGWLAKTLEDTALDIMASKNPEHPICQSIRGLKLCDRRKHRLFMRVEERFKAWTGESFAGFKTRTSAARTTLQQEESAP